MIKVVYPLTENESDQLVALNTDTILFVPCYYEPVGICIEEDTLLDPVFINYKELFDTFPPRDSVEVEIPGVPF